jgi:hypothetical protein
VKNLDEKRLLARMARNIGQPDLALEESITREEKLTENLFTKLPKTDEKPIASPLLVEENLFTPPKVSDQKSTLVDQAAAAIHAPTKKEVMVAEQMRDAELSGIRKQLTDVLAKVGTLSWGGGGTGAVRFDALDDHQHPADIRILEFNTAGPGVPVVPAGSLAWNPVEECLDVYQPDGTVCQVGLENYIRVYNNTGSPLTAGMFVMFSGVYEPADHSQEHAPTVVPFVANGAFPPLYTVGVLTEEILDGDYGRATTFGKVRHLNTTGASVGETWVVGDLLWAHPTIPGALTRVKPAAPDIALSVAAVLHVGAADGELLVRPTIFPQLHTGTFYSTVAQTAAQANTGYPVTWNGNGLKCPHINVANTSEVTVEDSGLFQFEFRLHLEAPKNQVGRVWLWVRVNGVDAPGSATEMSLYGSGTIEARMYPSWSFVQHMAAGSNLQLMWATDNTQLKIYAPEATAFAPSAYPAVIRAVQVNL